MKDITDLVRVAPIISGKKFKPGDTVRMRNYYLLMNVVCYLQDQQGKDRVVCVWIKQDFSLGEAALTEDVLVASPTDDQTDKLVIND